MVTVLITLSDNGEISVDARGPVKGTEGLAVLLESAAELARQGQVRIKLWVTRKPLGESDHKPWR